MRKKLIFSNILDLCRPLMQVLGALTAIGLGIVGWQVVTLPEAARAMMVPLLVLGGILGMVLLLLQHAYYALRGALREAEAQKNAAVALAHSDALTGAFTRAYFLESVKQAVHHGSETPVGYLQVDMDHLKALNDGNGHGAGDAALVHLVASIRKLAPDAVVGRLGGDEFGVAFIGHDNRAALMRIGRQLLDELGLPTMINGRATRLSASIGISMAPADASHVDELISKADLALYSGKRAGRGAVIGFSPEMLGDERHKRFVERELRAAILLNELELYYQPIYAADGLGLKSHEALVRWNHPVRGMIPPCDFIGVAEQSDLIDMLGEWVLRRACLDQPELGVPVSVNVSAAQLRRESFAMRFAGIVAETGVRGRDLIVEITETVPLAAGTVELNNIEGLRTLGVRIAIDDFGAGHASLQYLRGISFDIIKIDRTYVANVASNRVDRMLVTTICRLARAIGAEVVAEGVETIEQQTLLTEAGCTALQGYLLGRPQPLQRPMVPQGEGTAIASAA